MEDPRRTDIDFSQSRLRFPEDEGRHEWLPMLLDAYAMVDAGVELAIKEHAGRTGRPLACAKGCDSCCRSQTDIPLYPLELVGLYWYATEKLAGEARSTVKERLLFFTKDRPCPFLVKGECSVHPMRPVSCRQFNVFGEPCSPGEDPYFTRREDVLTPIREHTVRAFAAMLPFYGIKKESEEEVDRIINGEVRNLRSTDWKKLYKVMESFEAENPRAAG
ncbi:MAG: YkgJ family cysteine cluster protein [Nitrospirota bacterium]|jgi:Fe-S-cluster containining protein